MITTNYRQTNSKQHGIITRIIQFLIPDVPIDTYMKFFSTCATTFFIILAYSISRKAKDTCISLAAPVELISFVKLALVMPITILSVILYNLFSNKINRDKFAYWLSIPFVLYFGAFGIISIVKPSLLQTMCPNINLVPYSPLKCLDILFHEISLIINHFPVTVLYLSSEVYSVWDVNYVFWYLVNAYTYINDAKTLYPYYLLSSSLGLILSGVIGFIVNKALLLIPNAKLRYDTYYNGVCLVICCVSIILSRLCYRISLREHLKAYVFTDEDTKFEKKKQSITFKEKVGFLTKERIIGLSIVCVLMYMSSVVQLDAISKKMNYRYFITTLGDRGGFDNFLNKSQVIIGIATVSCSYFFRFITKRFCWLSTACVTPIGMFIASIVFFGAILINKYTAVGIDSVTPLKVAVYTGLLINILTKTCKYTFFDYSINMSLLHLNRESRNAGKSVIDSFGGRFGKAWGSFYMQALFSLKLTVQEMGMGQEIIAPYLFVAIIISCVVWLASVLGINNSIKKLSAKNTQNTTK